jgi:hypothetical protein
MPAIFTVTSAEVEYETDLRYGHASPALSLHFGNCCRVVVIPSSMRNRESFCGCTSSSSITGPALRPV